MEAHKIDGRADGKIIIFVKIIDTKRARLLAQMLPSESHFSFLTLGKKGAGVRVDTGRPMGRIEVGLEMEKGRTVAKRIGRVGSTRSRLARERSEELTVGQKIVTTQKGTRRGRVGAGGGLGRTPGGGTNQ